MTNNISKDELNLGQDELLSSDSGKIEYAAPVRGVAGVKSLFNSKNKASLIASGLAVLLISGGLYKSFSSVSEEDLKGGSSSVRSQIISTETSDQSSAIQVDEANRYNSEILPDLQKTNPSEHPVLVTDNSNPFVTKTEVVKPAKISEVGNTGVSTSTSQSIDRTSGIVQQDFKSIDALIKDVIEWEGSAVPSSYSVEWNYKSPEVAISEFNSNELGSAEVSRGQVGQSSCVNVAARAATMFMATTDFALNSDVGGPVSLTIRNGSLRGSKLLGEFERKEEWLRVTLNTLVTPDHTISTNAIGLDIESTLNAVQGDVDSHVLYRYGWWGFGTILSAVGKGAEINSDSNVTVTNGAVVESTKASSARELKIALGSLGESLGQAFQERINRPITVSLNVNDEVGVFFMTDVCLPASNSY